MLLTLNDSFENNENAKTSTIEAVETVKDTTKSDSKKDKVDVVTRKSS